MDLNTVIDVIRQPSDRPGAGWRTGDAWLAGGTWLFSEPQPTVRRLVDLTELGWPSLVPDAGGLEIAATCTIRELHEFVPPDGWLAGSLLRTSCEAFLASFKVWNTATVGGNICMSLPAGPMITMAVALEATYRLWATDGSERSVPASDFVTGNHQNVLRPGEILRSIHIPDDALRKRHTHRRFTLTKLGRSTIFMIATQSPAHRRSAAHDHGGYHDPVVLHFGPCPTRTHCKSTSMRYRADIWFADPNGTPEHRRHLAKHFAEEIRERRWRPVMSYTVNGKTFSQEPRPGQCLRTFCVRWAGTASKRAAMQAIAARVRCGSTADPVHSCITPAFRADGHKVTTIEGLGSPENLHPMQRQFRDAPGLPVRLLHAGHDHDGVRSDR